MTCLCPLPVTLKHLQLRKVTRQRSSTRTAMVCWRLQWEGDGASQLHLGSQPEPEGCFALGEVPERIKRRAEKGPQFFFQVSEICFVLLRGAGDKNLQRFLLLSGFTIQYKQKLNDPLCRSWIQTLNEFTFMLCTSSMHCILWNSSRLFRMLLGQWCTLDS